MQYEFGIIGLGVMGSNLARNVERNGFSVAVYNRELDWTEAFIRQHGGSGKFQGTRSYEELVAALARPRRILMMIKAGPPVDSVIETLRPLLEEGDILIDGGNSNFRDTERRLTELQPTGIRFFGMGVSGGEEGALWGPSLMPGGDRETYRHLDPVLTRIAAQADTGPCVTYVGSGSAGHFVKMVHNGIEYGDMQLIAESYDLMRNGMGLSPKEIAGTFSEWNQGELKSFLIEITARIADFPDDRGSDAVLLDRILDSAGQKGTGKWASTVALELGIPVPTITAAVDARIVSSMKALRTGTSRVYPSTPARTPAARSEVLEKLRAALYAAKICSYAQGFDLIRRGSLEFGYGVQLDEIARIWKAGCIIRAVFLDRIREAFRRNADLENLLLDDRFRSEIQSRIEPWRETVRRFVDLGLTAPAMTASLAYFDSLRRERLPANLIQAQRDLFGAHTYQRLDREGTFHTDWEAGQPEGD
jgi:6-phosphogluconate dehydrogenase